MPHPVVKKQQRYIDLHTVVEQGAALDQLDFRKLLFIDRVGSSRLLCP